MPIAVACPKCNFRGQAPDQAAGKNIKCRKCGTLFPVPLNVQLTVEPPANPFAFDAPATQQQNALQRLPPAPVPPPMPVPGPAGQPDPSRRLGLGILLGVGGTIAALGAGCVGLLLFCLWPFGGRQRTNAQCPNCQHEFNIPELNDTAAQMRQFRCPQCHIRLPAIEFYVEDAPAPTTTRKN